MAFSGGLNSSSGGELNLYLKWKRNPGGGASNNSPDFGLRLKPMYSLAFVDTFWGFFRNFT